MARVMGSLYDDLALPANPPTPAPSGVQIRLMQQDDLGVWRVKFKTNTLNASGDFDFPSVTAGDYRVRVQYPPDSTTPDRICWATSPYPLSVSGTLVYADIYAPTATAWQGVAATAEKPKTDRCCGKGERGHRFKLYKCSGAALGAADRKKLRHDLEKAQAKGYRIALLWETSELFAVDRDTRRGKPTFGETGLDASEFAPAPYTYNPSQEPPLKPDDEVDEADW